MSPNDKPQVLALIAEMCEMMPDFRLGQMICWLETHGQGEFKRGLYDLEDDQFLVVARKHHDTLARLRESVSQEGKTDQEAIPPLDSPSSSATQQHV